MVALDGIPESSEVAEAIKVILVCLDVGCSDVAVRLAPAKTRARVRRPATFDHLLNSAPHGSKHRRHCRLWPLWEEAVTCDDANRRL
jgi:hypothetical protein